LASDVRRPAMRACARCHEGIWGSARVGWSDPRGSWRRDLMKGMPMRRWAAAALLVVLFGGCASTDDPKTEPDTGEEPASEAAAPREEEAPEEEAEPEKPDNCEDVGMPMARAIATGAEDGVGKLKAKRVAAVKSPDFSEVYFIAVEFTGPGFETEPEVGVWASNSLTPGGGLILSVEGFAKEFTVWPDADTTDAAIESTDPSVEDAIACL
jgi:hypothetical protein